MEETLAKLALEQEKFMNKQMIAKNSHTINRKISFSREILKGEQKSKRKSKS